MRQNRPTRKRIPPVHTAHYSRVSGYSVYPIPTSSFKRRVILKQQFTIEKGYYDPVYNTPYSEPDGLRVSIIANSSSTAQNYETILSGAGSHGKCATFGVHVWVQAFGAELLFLVNKKR